MGYGIILGHHQPTELGRRGQKTFWKRFWRRRGKKQKTRILVDALPLPTSERLGASCSLRVLGFPPAGHICADLARRRAKGAQHSSAAGALRGVGAHCRPPFMCVQMTSAAPRPHGRVGSVRPPGTLWRCGSGMQSRPSSCSAATSDGCGSAAGLGSHRSRGRGLSCPCLCVHPLPHHRALRPHCCRRSICRCLFPLPPALFGHLCSALPMEAPRAPGGHLQAWAASIRCSSAYLGSSAIPRCSLAGPVRAPVLPSRCSLGQQPTGAKGIRHGPVLGGVLLLGGAGRCRLTSFSQIRSGQSKEMENSARVLFCNGRFQPGKDRHLLAVATFAFSGFQSRI